MLISPGGINIVFRILSFYLMINNIKVGSISAFGTSEKKMGVSDFGTVLAVWHVSKGGDLVIE